MTKREQDGKGVYRLASVFVGNSINHKNGLCQDEMSTIIIFVYTQQNLWAIFVEFERISICFVRTLYLYVRKLAKNQPL